MNADWNFGPDRDWNYSVQGSARKLAVGWRILWEPSVVMPALGPDGQAHLVRTEAMPPPTVKDIAGAPMLTEQTINAIKLDPAQMPDPGASTAAVASAIESVAPLITGPSLMQQLVVAQGQPITAVSLRDGDFEILEPDLTPIPGVVVEKQPRLITVDRRIVSPVLDALRKVWQDERDATAGWAVQVTAPGQAPQQMTGYQGPPGPDITSTLDSRLQLAALDAVVSVGTPAAIVAIQPSSGAVVAVAQNSYANDLGPIAFTQMHPVGENIDLLKAAAAVETNTPVEKVSDEDAISSAQRLGLGVDFDMAGLDQKTAQVNDDRLEGHAVRHGAGGGGDCAGHGAEPDDHGGPAGDDRSRISICCVRTSQSGCARCGAIRSPNRTSRHCAVTPTSSASRPVAATIVGSSASAATWHSRCGCRTPTVPTRP